MTKGDELEFQIRPAANRQTGQEKSIEMSATTVAPLQTAELSGFSEGMGNEG